MAEQYTKYKVASINMEPILYRKEENIEKELKLVEEAAQNGAKLIALPEMATTGYCWYSREEVAPFVESIPGPTTDRFHEIAKKYDCYIVVGMPEVDPDTDIYYNSATLIGPNGVIGTHRKTHGYISEAKWAKQGDLDHQVFDTPIGKIGMLICMDIHFIETARLEGLRGADIIVHVSNWLGEKTPAPYWITRAYENGCYVLEANRIGLERTVEFSGGSCLINPDGTLQSYTDSEESIVYGEVDLEKARENKFEDGLGKFSDRKPAKYQQMLLDTYLWNPLDFFTLYGKDPLPAGKKSNVAVVQFNPQKGNAETNISTITKYMEKAAADGVELIVFPELSMTGKPANESEAKEFAVFVDGKEINKILDVALKTRVYAVIGAVEKEEDKLYNSAFLIGPQGVDAKYRKMHLNKSDKLWAQEGNLGFVYGNIPVGRVGLLIGSDSLFPESGRCLALQGVDIIACPADEEGPTPYGLRETKAGHNYPIAKGYLNVHWHLWRTRACENNTYFIFSNTVGNGAMGRSGAFGPDPFYFPRNEMILGSENEEYGTYLVDTSNLSGTIYPTNIVRRKDMLSMRESRWYDLIVNENPPVLDK